VEVRKGDFDDPATLDAAFRGGERLLIVSTDSLDRPGHRFEQHRNAIEAAVRSGVKHVLYTSMVRATELDSPMILAQDHRLTESVLVESGVDYTILRNNWYAENLAGDIRHALMSGVLATASGEGKVGWITRHDCARAAAAALASEFQGKRILDITGPEALSTAEVARILAQVSGKSVESSPVSSSVRKGIFEQLGLPGPVADVLVNSEEGMAQGWLDVAPGDFRSLVGENATSFADFARTLV
jgi:NAD(P)H dehydrogenase (quinone)